MEKRRDKIGTPSKRLLRAAGLLAFAVPIAFALICATPDNARSQATSGSAVLPVYQYEVISIKSNKSGSPIPNGRPSDDGIDVTNFPLRYLIGGAFGVGSDRIIGLPDWVSSDRFDINAKMDTSVADALKKLSPDDRRAAQQQMLLSLFADRCKLKFHRETKELPAYLLVLAKNGPKFQKSKSGGAAPANAIKVPDGHGGTGYVLPGERGSQTIHGLPITFLLPMLSAQLGRTVVDKTGLTGTYDFVWDFQPDSSQAQPPADGAPNGGSQTIPSDPQGASLFTVIQEKLGLKLESGKGPVEVIVIDHIERPSGN